MDTIVQVTTGTGMHEAVLGTYQESELDSIYEGTFFSANGSEAMEKAVYL